MGLELAVIIGGLYFVGVGILIGYFIKDLREDIKNGRQRKKAEQTEFPKGE